MSQRFEITTQNRVQEESFATDILIVCDRCGKDAVLVGLRGTTPQISFVEEASCAHCGRVWQVKPPTRSSSDDGSLPRYQWLKLWLSTDFRGHRLWAYNEQHLCWLESFIGAEIREDKLAGGSSALHAILPRWMTSSKNRDDVIAALAKLRKKLPAR